MNRMVAVELIENSAREAGFDFCSVTGATPPASVSNLRRWVAAGYAADMRWFARGLEQRADPRRLLPDVQTIVTVGLSYFCEHPSPDLWNDPARGRLARYAWGPDYHELIRSHIKTLVDLLESALGRHFHWRACVDSSPLLERHFASRHIGFIGRQSVYIHPTFGLYTVLGELLISEPAQPTVCPPLVHSECPPCSACLDGCPTQALVAPYTLDARRCIAYHTVENRQAIPLDVRKRTGNWLFGCDDCLQACPFAAALSRPGRLSAWRFEPDRCCPLLSDVLQWTESDFLTRYRGTAVERLGWRLFMRNALVAAGNSRLRALEHPVQRFTKHTDALLKSHAEWALAQIGQAPH